MKSEKLDGFLEGKWISTRGNGDGKRPRGEVREKFLFSASRLEAREQLCNLAPSLIELH